MRRRTFIKTLATGTAATLLVDGTPLAKAAANLFHLPVSPTLAELQDHFLSPPPKAQPWVYWFVSDGNITKEGITADLEAMHRVGIRGVLYMEVDQNCPPGPARFMSPEWRELIKFAVSEATRLDMTIDMNDCAGWCASAGPWITPELSMQMVVSTETQVRGGVRFTGVLPQPLTKQDYYRDIAVLAFPTPAAAMGRMADASPEITYGLERVTLNDAGRLMDGSIAASVLIPFPAKGQKQCLNFDFPAQFTAQSLTLSPPTGGFFADSLDVTLEVSDDGHEYRAVKDLSFHWPVSSANFPKTTSQHFRVSVNVPMPDDFMPDPDSEKGAFIAEALLSPEMRIEDIPGKALYIRQDTIAGEGAMTPEMVVPRERIVDISSRMDAHGHLDWEAPAGDWTVLRFGYTTTGVVNHPAPKEGLGLDCDKLSKKAVEANFEGMMGKLVADQASIGGKAMTLTHIDSWETGSQNWTPGFEQMFRERTGYDVVPYLPVLTGRAVESLRVSERFLWDLRRVIADLLLENYAGHMRKISNQHGLDLSIEAYGGGPLDELAYAGEADRPMSEFWTGEYPLSINKEMASSAHVYGKPIIGAESFTAVTSEAKWQNHPFQLKELGDHAFTIGINHFVFHRYSMQPWLNRAPGMTMGPWGINMERTNTWWEQSRGWLMYLSRCQYLLQAGRFIADIAYLGSENAPSSFPDRDSLNPAVPVGYDYDAVSQQAVREMMTVKDGRLVLPSGMSYRVLVLPQSRTMTPALMTKIRDLALNGATIIGAPPSESPSLVGFPKCDDQIRELTAELWGECNGSSITENQVGSGRVIWGRSVADVLDEMKMIPDFGCSGWPDRSNIKVGEQIRYIHRQVEEDDVYFVASGCPEAREFVCTFRVTGKRPELWWPDSGKTEKIAVYEEGGLAFGFSSPNKGSIRIPIQLDPYGSVFVVFRGSAKPSTNRIVSVRRNGTEISGISPTRVFEVQLGDSMEMVRVEENSDESYSFKSYEPGNYELKSALGHTLQVNVPPLAKPLAIEGPWELHFPKGWKAPEQVTLDRLISWTEHSDPGVKYFSGTATYRCRFNGPAVETERKLCLDLGNVQVIAEVMINGKDLGILWKPPFRVDITNVVHPGPNMLEVRVVNLWPNRLIGDDLLPPDCEWKKGFMASEVIKEWPAWLSTKQPSPTGRASFAAWRLWTKDDPLLPSGLLGPVRIVTSADLGVKLS